MNKPPGWFLRAILGEDVSTRMPGRARGDPPAGINQGVSAEVQFGWRCGETPACIYQDVAVAVHV